MWLHGRHLIISYWLYIFGAPPRPSASPTVDKHKQVHWLSGTDGITWHAPQRRIQPSCRTGEWDGASVLAASATFVPRSGS